MRESKGAGLPCLNSNPSSSAHSWGMAMGPYYSQFVILSKSGTHHSLLMGLLGDQLRLHVKCLSYHPAF